VHSLLHLPVPTRGTVLGSASEQLRSHQKSKNKQKKEKEKKEKKEKTRYSIRGESLLNSNDASIS